ncbi:tryptophan synthase subunit alpha [Bacillus sp. JJ1609]|uniref:tryptophan synthase subunit alpha n=1 Tax=Bacillus sp. JJ1609 TaxID=3122977 RepID=UPI002FFF283C
MNKIQTALTNKGKKIFVPYIMAGDGGLKSLREKLLFLQDSGADAIEVGIPFSDPVADGPIIQRAGIRALKEGTTLKKVLGALKEFNDEVTVPLILMTYLNPLIAYGYEQFAKDAEISGVAGCIIPDLPIEEEGLIVPYLEKENLTLIRLVTLTTPVERIREIAGKSAGFIYAVTVTGTTGTRNEFSNDLAGFLKTVKSLSSVPVLAGFGVSNKEQIQEVCKHCDGVIVGSKVIDLFEQGKYEEIQNLIHSAEIVNI